MLALMEACQQDLHDCAYEKMLEAIVLEESMFCAIVASLEAVL